MLKETDFQSVNFHVSEKRELAGPFLAAVDAQLSCIWSNSSWKHKVLEVHHQPNVHNGVLSELSVYIVYWRISLETRK